MTHETKQLLKNIAIGLAVFSLVGLLLYGTWHGTRLPQLTISTVEVIGGETISHSAVAADVERLLEGEYLRFIPRRFAWLYPGGDIKAALLQVERVKNPTINRDGKALMVTLDEYLPAALWCDASDRTRCVFMDDAGFAFAPAPALAGGAFVRYVRVGQGPTQGESFTDASDYAQLMTIVDLLEESSWPVVAVELDQARDGFVKLAGGAELKVSLLLTPEQTMDNLQTVLSTEQYRHLTPANFVYIDLRFGNKVFVSEFGAPVEEVIDEAKVDLEVVDQVETQVTTEPELEIETAASGDAAGE